MRDLVLGKVREKEKSPKPSPTVVNGQPKSIQRESYCNPPIIDTSVNTAEFSLVRQTTVRSSGHGRSCAQTSTRPAFLSHNPVPSPRKIIFSRSSDHKRRASSKTPNSSFFHQFPLQQDLISKWFGFAFVTALVAENWRNVSRPEADVVISTLFGSLGTETLPECCLYISRAYIVQQLEQRVQIKNYLSQLLPAIRWRTILNCADYHR